jgi:DNA repair protein RecO (recombination protein O)
VVLALETGKIKILGKGTRRLNAKLAGNLEPITQVEIFIAKTKGMGKITGAIPLENFSKLKSNLELLENVFYIIKILEKMLPESAKDEKIFNDLISLLAIFNDFSSESDNKEKMDVLTLGFLFKVFDELGYRLEVERCLICDNKLKLENNYFSIFRGGILCQNCQNQEKKKIKINNESIKLIRIFLKNEIKSLLKLKVSSRDIDNLKLVVNETINWLI